jgi:hypothetical protein
MRASFRYIILIFFFSACILKSNGLAGQAAQPEIRLEEHAQEKRLDVLIDGKLFTSYRWPEGVYKPILYPIITSGGNEITRGFPLRTRAGERNDHRHQVGSWLNYGNVNGYDFWGNGHAGERSVNGGEIKHVSVKKLREGREAAMRATASWVDPAGKELLSESTEYYFIVNGPVRIIDRVTTLTASGKDSVHFKDTKEGMFAVRVSRELELASDEKVTLTDANGNATIKQISNDRVTGNYRSSEGVTGEDVWSTRAKWMNLYGSIASEKISLVICDHPQNISYPTWWHARGYGLFSANPFGAKDFTKGQQELNYRLPAGQSLIFRYRIIVGSGDHHLTDHEINAYADDFAKMYERNRN